MGYGLTFVVGLPFAGAFAAQLGAAQARVAAEDGARGGAWRWRPATQWHATLAAARRTQAEPLTRADLPADIDGFAEALGELFAGCAPFAIAADAPALDARGVLAVACSAPEGAALKAALAGVLARFGGDPPKHAGAGLFVTLGEREEPPAAAATAMLLAAAARGIDRGAGSTVEAAHLVYYADRTLAAVVASVTFPLGRRAGLGGAELAARLFGRGVA